MDNLSPEGARQRRILHPVLARADHRQRHRAGPRHRIRAVPGLVKVVTRKEIADADWSLTPGRYVGVAPLEVDDDFDFEQAISDIHVELAALNQEAIELAGKIQDNFEELGV